MLYVGLVAPVTFPVSVEVGNSDLDLTTVTDCTIEVRKPDGSTDSWDTAISSKLAASMTVTHSFSAAPSEVDQPGTWNFYLKFTVPGGFQRSEAWTEEVKREHGNG